MEPTIDLIPLRAAVSTEKATTLDVLVRITPPRPEVEVRRPVLNLALVIDRSGSMSGEKITYARQAASFAVQQLLPHDRVSVTVFDDRVDVIQPSVQASGKAAILEAIRRVEPGGSTALHEGWRQGGIQVSEHMRPEHLNRVILLSDGQANVGETNPDMIATDVHKLAGLGVSTTTMGVGDDYNEDLMTAMANSGDGNYYYIQSPGQLTDFFTTELQGLMATVGTKVSLGVTPGADVLVEDVLNDFEKTSTKRYKLPTLIVGNAVEVVVRLKVPAQAGESELVKFRLSWDVPGGKRQVLECALTLPAVSEAQLSEFPPNEDVQRVTALLMAARARDEAVRLMDRGDYAAARSSLTAAGQVLSCMAPSALMSQEMDALSSLGEVLESGDVARARKQARFESYQQKRGRKE